MPRNPAEPLAEPLFHEPAFGESQALPDPAGFDVDHPSDSGIYRQISALLKTDVVAFPPSRLPDTELYALAEAYGSRGAAITQTITQAGRIVFHALGDTGATSAGLAYNNELSVADQLTLDCNTTDTPNRPAFLLHLGDVVYDFGESQYYYDQFYSPYRNYPAPIFAIPGNHDSFILPNTPAGETPLEIFARNFCATDPVITPEAGSLHRTAMTQPGVYYALDAPFVRILCLFSNALEDPGVISSQNGHFAKVPDLQLAFLEAQLTKIADEKYKGAVLIAVHHPPFSFSAPSTRAAGHGSSLAMLQQIDEICGRVGVYPHAILSGHAHNYQRYTRSFKFGSATVEVPFIVCGDGGHHVNTLVRSRAGTPASEPHFGTDVSYMDSKPAIGATTLTLEKYNDSSFGYLRISADATTLGIGFHLAGGPSLAQSRFDKVSIDIATSSLVAN